MRGTPARKRPVGLVSAGRIALQGRQVLQVDALGAARLVWGFYLLAWPESVLRLLSPTATDPTWRAVARVLGTRQATQGLLTVVGGPRTLGWGAAVDVGHGASAAALALVRPDRRRLGVEEAVSAAVLAGIGLALRSSLRKVRFG